MAGLFPVAGVLLIVGFLLTAGPVQVEGLLPVTGAFLIEGLLPIAGAPVLPGEEPAMDLPLRLRPKIEEAPCWPAGVDQRDLVSADIPPVVLLAGSIRE